MERCRRQFVPICMSSCFPWLCAKVAKWLRRWDWWFDPVHVSKCSWPRHLTPSCHQWTSQHLAWQLCSSALCLQRIKVLYKCCPLSHDVHFMEMPTFSVNSTIVVLHIYSRDFKMLPTFIIFIWEKIWRCLGWLSRRLEEQRSISEPCSNYISRRRQFQVWGRNKCN